MNPKVYIFINGILNFPGSHKGWTDRAVTWVHTNTSDKAEKFEYFASALLRRFTQNKNARELAELVNSYAGHRIILVAHSNGCDLVCRALKWITETISEVHLVSGACDADFEKNGLNHYIAKWKVLRVIVYVAEQDKAMLAARASQVIVGWLGLGYGTIGLSGPQRANYPVEVVRKHDYGHSSWFDISNFETFMWDVTCSSYQLGRVA